jgi:pyruvate kinase
MTKKTDILAQVKIIATLGTATTTDASVVSLARAGVNVFRINLSHEQPAGALERLKQIRRVEKAIGRPLAVMGDLAGPKIRIGAVAPDTVLEVGERVAIGGKAIIGNAERFSVNHGRILDALRKGSIIYIGDGALKLAVVRKNADGVIAEVLIGGPLGSRKGFIAHGMPVLRFGLTKQDREHIKLLAPAGIDSFAVSFVQTARDIHTVRNELPRTAHQFLVAKIETPSGVTHAEEIMAASDAVMVARGDLGFAMPLAELPYVQKEIITLGLRMAKPVITATQMLESMTQYPVPTRAEVTDVANAILDGTDAVMLSGETAVGKFPLQTVETLRGIANEAALRVLRQEFERSTVSSAVSASTVKIAERVNARLIVVFTESGTTARHIARHRPGQPILALSPREKTLRELSFTWGVFPERIRGIKTIEEAIKIACERARKNNIRPLRKGEPFVISAGLPFGQPGSTNFALVQHA